MAYFFDGGHEEPVADDGEGDEKVEGDHDVDDHGARLPLSLVEDVPGEVVDGRGSAVRPWEQKKTGKKTAKNGEQWISFDNVETERTTRVLKSTCSLSKATFGTMRARHAHKTNRSAPTNAATEPHFSSQQSTSGPFFRGITYSPDRKVLDRLYWRNKRQFNKDVSSS